MEIYNIKILKNREEELLPLLRDKIFHYVNTYEKYEKILSSGEIKNNKSKKFDFSYPQSENSYGSEKGYVCLFDLKKVTDEQLFGGEGILGILSKLYFLQYNIFFILKDDIEDSLISWERAEQERAYKKIYIPYGEYWFDGNINLNFVEKVIIVNE